MRVVLLRVGIDSYYGRLHSPLFKNGSFEFIPIPDYSEIDTRTYGNTVGRYGRPLIDYFPERRREREAFLPMHVDPEFTTFTYGDPTSPKRGLAKLRPGNLLVFYSGMQGWDFYSPPALYLCGIFKVDLAGFASQFSEKQLREEFGQNFHVRHPSVFRKDRKDLVLVKGGSGSRMFKKAQLVGRRVLRPSGRYWQFVTPEMKAVFGTFGGIGSLQRSTPRWVEESLTAEAAEFVLSLP